MNKRTYTLLFAPLTVALVASAAFIAWQWGAPWGMQAALTAITPALQRACRASAGCRRIDTATFWNSGRSRYETVATLVVNKRMPSDARKMLGDITRAEIGNAPSVLYRANLRALVVSFEYD